MSQIAWRDAWEEVADELRSLTAERAEHFCQRLQVGWGDIMRPLRLLYGNRPDFDRWVAQCVRVAARGFAARPDTLHWRDIRRLHEPDWHRRADAIGYIAYADRFAGDLAGVRDHIDYLNQLGVNVLHLMPLLQPRQGANDGGYAVADYRSVDSRLGDMAEFRRLAAALHAADIALMIDFVCNHTADDHVWAQRARAGDERYAAYYLLFDAEAELDAYKPYLRTIFPEVKTDNFIFEPSMQKWVWSTFNPYQWDLNYRNPAVFAEMVDVMLFLANQGVDILRMDAVAFMWKEPGTSCENLPQVHALLQAMRALTRLAAPSLLLVAEAIVAPEDVVPYFGVGTAANRECDLAYHNAYMVHLWNMLAEGDVRLSTLALQAIPEIPSQATWLAYARCHDDIGWAITEADAARVGRSGFHHRAFLSDFYSGQFEGSFARGAVFQFNPLNQDRRISGTLASLAGLERAIEAQRWPDVSLAISRILLLHTLILAYGGLPLIYMGDELGLLNDYDYRHVPEHSDDNRWLHRPKMDWRFAESRHDPLSIQGRVFSGIRHLIDVRRHTPALHAEAAAIPEWCHNDQVFALARRSPRGDLLVLANVTAADQWVPGYRLAELGFGGRHQDLLTRELVDGQRDLKLLPYQAVWLA